MPRRTQDEIIEAWFANSVYDEATGCWLWQGCVAGRGYGVTCWQGKQVYVHRLAYQFEHPEEKLNVIRHTCDTPNCWNVDHLVNGTTRENINDKLAKGRQPIGSSVGNSRFVEAQIVEIRKSDLNIYQLGRLYSVCPQTIWHIRQRNTWKHVP